MSLSENPDTVLQNMKQFVFCDLTVGVVLLLGPLRILLVGVMTALRRLPIAQINYCSARTATIYLIIRCIHPARMLY